jgi:hypothetical protein
LVKVVGSPNAGLAGRRKLARAPDILIDAGAGTARGTSLYADARLAQPLAQVAPPSEE